MNPLVFAYIGDAIYEVYVREYLINKKIVKVNDLQKESIKYVSAESQSKILKDLINKEFLNDFELDIIRKGRNTKSLSKPKNTDVLTYKHATALESLIGFLYLNKDTDRINQIMKEILGD